MEVFKEHLYTSSTFYVAMQNGTCFFYSAKTVVSSLSCVPSIAMGLGPAGSMLQS